MHFPVADSPVCPGGAIAQASPSIERVSALEVADLPDVMALVHRQKWEGYSIEDLSLIMSLSPGHCFKLLHGAQLVGSSFALAVGPVSCVSFFLIHPEHRSLRNARALGLTCLAAAQHNADAVVTYANRAAVQAYTRFGFRALHWVRRFQATLAGAPGPHRPKVRPVTIQDLAGLDARCYGRHRPRLLDALPIYAGAQAYGYGSGEELTGAAFIRKTDRGWFVGPLIALHQSIALELLAGVLSHLPLRTALLDLNDARLVDAGAGAVSFRETPLAVRKMCLGDEHALEDSRLLYAIGGHHLQ